MKRIFKFIFLLSTLGLIVGGALWMCRDVLRQAYWLSILTSERAETDFKNYSTRLETSQNLQVSTLEQIEVFERTSHAAILWDSFKLPDIVVRATVPVVFTYFVDLKKHWSIERLRSHFIVKAPALQFNEPAADVSQLKFEVAEGSVLRNESEVISALQTQLMDLLRERAQTNLSLVREAARNEISTFVRHWLKSQYEIDGSKHLIVLFEGEPLPANSELFNKE